MKKLIFISYDGKYPNLCDGQLILKIGRKKIVFPNYCLSSGGSAGVSRDEGYCSSGLWTISKFPKDFPTELRQEAEKIINENIKHGCCGGCI